MRNSLEPIFDETKQVKPISEDGIKPLSSVRAVRLGSGLFPMILQNIAPQLNGFSNFALPNMTPLQDVQNDDQPMISSEGEGPKPMTIGTLSGLVPDDIAKSIKGAMGDIRNFATKLSGMKNMREVTKVLQKKMSAFKSIGRAIQEENGVVGKLTNAFTETTELAEIFSTLPIEEMKTELTQRVEMLAGENGQAPKEFDLLSLIPPSMHTHFKKVGAKLGQILDPILAGEKKKSRSFLEIAQQAMDKSKGGQCLRVSQLDAKKNSAIVRSQP